MEQLVMVSLGYYSFLLPVTKAVEFLQLASVMQAVDRNYLGTGKPGADSEGYVLSNIRPAKAEVSLADMGNVCAQLAIQRMEEDNKKEVRHD